MSRKKRKPDPDAVLIASTKWHTQARGLITMLFEQVGEMTAALRDADHPLHVAWNRTELLDLERDLGDVMSALTVLTPPVHPSTPLESPLVVCG